MNTFINWSGFLLFAYFTFKLWARAGEKGWRRSYDVSLVLMFIFAGALGEWWYHGHQSVPWCFGFEQSLALRNDALPLCTLFLLAVGIPFFTRWIVMKVAEKYNASERTPGSIPQTWVAFFPIAIACWATVVGCAYNQKLGNIALGEKALSGVHTLASAAVSGLSWVLSNINLLPN